MFTKVAVLCAAFAAANATILAAPIITTGISSSSKTQDALGNYAFNYGIANGLGGTNARTEIGDAAGNKKGSYTLTDADGRTRRVDYVADAAGFRASINTNEPGTALSAPASAAVISPYAPPVAPAPIAPAAPISPITAPAASLLAFGAPLAAAFSSPLGLGLSPLAQTLIW